MRTATEQPPWLVAVVMGLVGNSKWSVFLEGKKYAIIVRAGHNSYLNRGSGVRYFPTEYVLVERWKNYWEGTWDTVHTGRMSNEVRRKLGNLLSVKDQS